MSRESHASTAWILANGRCVGVTAFKSCAGPQLVKDSTRGIDPSAAGHRHEGPALDLHRRAIPAWRANDVDDVLSIASAGGEHRLAHSSLSHAGNSVEGEGGGLHGERTPHRPRTSGTARALTSLQYENAAHPRGVLSFMSQHES